MTKQKAQDEDDVEDGCEEQREEDHGGKIVVEEIEDTICALRQRDPALYEQLASLIAENATLRKELEEARLNERDREFQFAVAAEKQAPDK